jgi:hypothetical protein
MVDARPKSVRISNTSKARHSSDALEQDTIENGRESMDQGDDIATASDVDEGDSGNRQWDFLSTSGQISCSVIPSARYGLFVRMCACD